jgi:hypothetical protein
MKTSEKFYEISTQINSTVQNVDNVLERIVKKPKYKKIIYKIFPKSEIAQIEEAILVLKERKVEMYQQKQILQQLENDLKIENQKILETLENENLDLELVTQLKSKQIINQELLNQIPILFDLIRTNIIKLEKSLPFLEKTLKDQNTIKVTLKSLQLLVQNVIELENYSKKLEKENHKLLKEMVTNTTDMIVNSIDIEYYKDMKKRNEELSKTFQKAKQNYLEKLQKLENELDGILKINIKDIK